jgi:hypothetical protein
MKFKCKLSAGESAFSRIINEVGAVDKMSKAFPTREMVVKKVSHKRIKGVISIVIELENGGKWTYESNLLDS